MALPDELMVRGWPRVTVSAASSNIAQATTGAPALRRQSLQWQSATPWGVPLS